MQISEIRIKLVGNRTDRLKAFSSVTFDNSFVVRDLKIIEGAEGYFVAMPSRKLMDRCHGCGSKNHLRAKFCNECGARLDDVRSKRRSDSGRTKIHADVAHPINSESRDYIQQEVVKAFKRELDLSNEPGYQPANIDDYDDESHGARSEMEEPRTGTPEQPTEPRPMAEPSAGYSDSQPSPEPEQGESGFSDGIV
jgi:stage V sporulation protein G